MPWKTAALLITLALCSGIAAPAAAATKMYKWVDENGVVHYSATPAEETKTEEVQIRPGPGAGAPGEIAVIADPAEVARCAQVRKNVELLLDPSRKLDIKDADGNVRPMTREEKEPQLKAHLAALEACKAVPTPSAPPK
jgi:hypothetical protein